MWQPASVPDKPDISADEFRQRQQELERGFVNCGLKGTDAYIFWPNTDSDNHGQTWEEFYRLKAEGRQTDPAQDGPDEYSGGSGSGETSGESLKNGNSGASGGAGASYGTGNPGGTGTHNRSGSSGQGVTQPKDGYDADEYDNPDDFADEYWEEFSELPNDEDDAWQEAYDYWEENH